MGITGIGSFITAHNTPMHGPPTQGGPAPVSSTQYYAAAGSTDDWVGGDPRLNHYSGSLAAFTVSFFVKFDSISLTNHSFIGYGSEATSDWLADNTMCEFTMNSGTLSVTVNQDSSDHKEYAFSDTFVADRWYHIAVCFAGTVSTNDMKLYLYLNGEHDTSVTKTTDTSIGSAVFNGNTVFRYIGHTNPISVSDFRMYDACASASDVALLANHENPPGLGYPLQHLRMNEGSGGLIDYGSAKDTITQDGTTDSSFWNVGYVAYPYEVPAFLYDWTEATTPYIDNQGRVEYASNVWSNNGGTVATATGGINGYNYVDLSAGTGGMRTASTTHTAALHTTMFVGKIAGVSSGQAVDLISTSTTPAGVTLVNHATYGNVMAGVQHSQSVENNDEISQETGVWDDDAWFVLFVVRSRGMTRWVYVNLDDGTCHQGYLHSDGVAWVNASTAFRINITENSDITTQYMTEFAAWEKRLSYTEINDIGLNYIAPKYNITWPGIEPFFSIGAYAEGLYNVHETNNKNLLTLDGSRVTTWPPNQGVGMVAGSKLDENETDLGMDLNTTDGIWGYAKLDGVAGEGYTSALSNHTAHNNITTGAAYIIARVADTVTEESKIFKLNPDVQLQVRQSSDSTRVTINNAGISNSTKNNTLVDGDITVLVVVGGSTHGYLLGYTASARASFSTTANSKGRSNSLSAATGAFFDTEPIEIGMDGLSTDGLEVYEAGILAGDCTQEDYINIMSYIRHKYRIPVHAHRSLRAFGPVIYYDFTDEGCRNTASESSWTDLGTQSDDLTVTGASTKPKRCAFNGFYGLVPQATDTYFSRTFDSALSTSTTGAIVCAFSVRDHDTSSGVFSGGTNQPDVIVSTHPALQGSSSIGYRRAGTARDAYATMRGTWIVVIDCQLGEMFVSSESSGFVDHTGVGDATLSDMTTLALSTDGTTASTNVSIHEWAYIDSATTNADINELGTHMAKKYDLAWAMPGYEAVSPTWHKLRSPGRYFCPGGVEPLHYYDFTDPWSVDFNADDMTINKVFDTGSAAFSGTTTTDDLTPVSGATGAEIPRLRLSTYGTHSFRNMGQLSSVGVPYGLVKTSLNTPADSANGWTVLCVHELFEEVTGRDAIFDLDPANAKATDIYMRTNGTGDLEFRSPDGTATVGNTNLTYTPGIISIGVVRGDKTDGTPGSYHYWSISGNPGTGISYGRHAKDNNETVYDIDSLQIGGAQNATGTASDGCRGTGIYELGIWNDALSDQEVHELLSLVCGRYGLRVLEMTSHTQYQAGV